MAQQGCPCPQCSQGLSGQGASRPSIGPNIKSYEGTTAFGVDRDHFVSQKEAKKPTGGTDCIEQHPFPAGQPAVRPDAQEGQSHKKPLRHMNYTSSLPMRTYDSPASRMNVEERKLSADVLDSSVAACNSPKKPMYDLDNVLRQEDRNPLVSSEIITTDFDFDSFLTNEADESGAMTSLQNHDQESQSCTEEQPAYVQMREPQPFAHGNHALQDYQVQLMLLEQRNKKRLLMAREAMEIAKQEENKGQNSDERPHREIHQERKPPVTERVDAYDQSHDLGTGPTSHTSNHHLQDYQMQLMLLEQQNVKRVNMARQAETLTKERKEKETKSKEQLRETTRQQYAKTHAFAEVPPENLGNALQDHAMQLMLLEQHKKKQALSVKDKQHESSIDSQTDPKAEHRHRSPDALSGDEDFSDKVGSKVLLGDMAVKTDPESLNRESCELGGFGKEKPHTSQESHVTPAKSQMAQSPTQIMLQRRQLQQMRQQQQMQMQQQQRQQAEPSCKASEPENLQGVRNEAMATKPSSPGIHHATPSMQGGLGHSLQQAQFQWAQSIQQRQGAQQAANMARQAQQAQAQAMHVQQQMMRSRLKTNQMQMSRAKDSTEQTQTIPKPQAINAQSVDTSQAHDSTQKNQQKQDCDNQAAVGTQQQQQQQQNVTQSPQTATDGHWRRAPLTIDARNAEMSNLRTFNSYLHRTVKEQKQTISKLQTRLKEQDAQLAIMYRRQQAGGDWGIMPKDYPIPQGGPFNTAAEHWLGLQKLAAAKDDARRVGGQVVCGDDSTIQPPGAAAAASSSKGSSSSESDDEDDEDEEEDGEDEEEPSSCDDVHGGERHLDGCRACHNLLKDWDFVDVAENGDE